MAKGVITTKVRSHHEETIHQEETIHFLLCGREDGKGSAVVEAVDGGTVRLAAGKEFPNYCTHKYSLVE